MRQPINPPGNKVFAKNSGLGEAKNTIHNLECQANRGNENGYIEMLIETPPPPSPKRGLTILLLTDPKV